MAYTWRNVSRKGNKFEGNSIEPQLPNIIQLACQHV